MCTNCYWDKSNGCECTEPMSEEDVEKIEIDPMKKQETIELVRAYYRISNRALAKQLFDLIVSLSKTSSKVVDE